eukprot:1637112-Rhodomonas_salina.3
MQRRPKLREPKARQRSNGKQRRKRRREKTPHRQKERKREDAYLRRHDPRACSIPEHTPH